MPFNGGSTINIAASEERKHARKRHDGIGAPLRASTVNLKDRVVIFQAEPTPMGQRVTVDRELC